MWVPPLMIGSLGMTELLIILFIIVLIFGASKLPQLGAGMGEFIKNFKKSVRGDTEELPPESADTSKKDA